MLKLIELSPDEANTVAEAPQDALDKIEDFDQRTRALDEAAKDFTRASAQLHREIINERIDMWNDLANRYGLDVNKHTYQIASVNGKPVIVRKETEE